MHVRKSNFHDYIVVLRTAFDLVCNLRVCCCCVCVVCRPRAPVWELEDEGIQPDITSDKGRSSSDNRTSMTSTASTFSYGETKILYTLWIPIGVDRIVENFQGRKHSRISLF